MENLKNLYLTVLNSFGLTTLFVYFTQILSQDTFVLVAWLYAGALLALTVYYPKLMAILLKGVLALKLIFVGYTIFELPVSILVFLVSAISLELIVLIALKIELEEACYYRPDNRILSNPINYQVATLIVNEKTKFEISIVDASENYMTFITNKSFANRVKGELLDGVLSLRSKDYFLRAKLCWWKNNYYCIELSGEKDLKDNQWAMIYDKIKCLKVI